MSGTVNSDAKAPMEQSNEDLSKVMGQLSVTAGDSNERSNPPGILSDMPVDVVGLIIGRSDYKEQLILRKTSKSLRELVDKEEPSLKSLKICCLPNYIECFYNGQRITYISPRDEMLSWFAKKGYIVEKDDFEQVAFDDFAFTLKNPKLHLETFSFESYYDEEEENFIIDDGRNWEFGNRFRNMQSILKSIKHQLSVKAFNIDVASLHNAMSILPYLKPGVLEKIAICPEFIDDGWVEYFEIMKHVALLDQWKQAEVLHLKILCDNEFPTQHATHFKRFQIDDCRITRDFVVLIRDYVLEHENVEFCSILADCDESIGLFDGILGTPVLSHYTVPNSQYYLEIMITEGCDITMKKKKKQ